MVGTFSASASLMMSVAGSMLSSFNLIWVRDWGKTCIQKVLLCRLENGVSKCFLITEGELAGLLGYGADLSRSEYGQLLHAVEEGHLYLEVIFQQASQDIDRLKALFSPIHCHEYSLLHRYLLCDQKVSGNTPENIRRREKRDVYLLYCMNDSAGWQTLHEEFAVVLLEKPRIEDGNHPLSVEDRMSRPTPCFRCMMARGTWYSKKGLLPCSAICPIRAAISGSSGTSKGACR